MKVLIVGYGSIGKRHEKNCRALGATVDVYSKHESKTKIRSDSYDLIVIASETARRKADIKRFLSYSKTFFLEKPLAKTEKEAKQVATLLKGKRVQVGYNFLFHPLVRKARELVEKHKVGTILSAELHCGSYLPDWRSTDYRKGYSASRERGGGVELDLIHEVNYASFVLNKELSLVCAIRDHVSQLETSSNDFAMFSFKYGNTTDKGYISVTLNYYERTPRRTCILVGEKGVITLDLVDLSLVVQLAGGKRMKYSKKTFDRNEMYLDEMRYALNVAKKKENIPVELSIKQALRDVSLVTK